MKFNFFILFYLLSFLLKAQSPTQSNNQPKKQPQKPKIIYELHTTHIPLFIGSSFFYSIGNNLVRKQTPLLEQDLVFLNRSSVNLVDRFATYLWSPTFARISDATLILSGLSTPLLFLDKKIKKEWFTIGFMFLEASVLSYGITQTTKGLTDRIRPFVYNPNAPIEKKLEPDAKHSFFSGHTALTATYSFLTYKIYSDFYPKSDLKPYFLVGAIGLPFLTASSRVLAGKHYLSDVLTGFALGALVGYGLPYLHRKKIRPNSPSSSINILIIPSF